MPETMDTREHSEHHALKQRCLTIVLRGEVFTIRLQRTRVLSLQLSRDSFAFA
jgi:hypothetical protein